MQPSLFALVSWLDLAGIAQLVSALASYRGALLVVSHDHRFLADLGIDRWWQLDDGELGELPGPSGQ